MDKQYTIKENLKELQLMNVLITSALATKGKKGYANYTKARNKLFNNIAELSIDKDKQTVFQKIKKSVVSKEESNTIFSKLKYLNKD